MWCCIFSHLYIFIFFKKLLKVCCVWTNTPMTSSSDTSKQASTATPPSHLFPSPSLRDVENAADAQLSSRSLIRQQQCRRWRSKTRKIEPLQSSASVHANCFLSLSVPTPLSAPFFLHPNPFFTQNTFHTFTWSVLPSSFITSTRSSVPTPTRPVLGRDVRVCSLWS